MTIDTATFLAQLGNHSDQQTGAISPPIYLSTTFAHPELGQSTGYDYTRTKNPTRDILEAGLAELEKGARAVVTSSGMSAIALIFDLFTSGSRFWFLVICMAATFAILQNWKKANGHSSIPSAL